MELEQTTIYPFIKHDSEARRIYSFRPRDVIVHSYDKNSYIWYLISGFVEVSTSTLDGKSFLVDTFGEDNYVGHLSNFSNQNFYCNSISVTASKLIRIPVSTFRQMLNDTHFSNHFYTKVSTRLHEMYKKDLIHHLFTQRQQFAFYICSHAKDGVCHIKSINTLCEEMRISRRNFFNLIGYFSSKGILKRSKTGDIFITDSSLLKEISKVVWDFYFNKQ